MCQRRPTTRDCKPEAAIKISIFKPLIRKLPNNHILFFISKSRLEKYFNYKETWRLTWDPTYLPLSPSSPYKITSKQFLTSSDLTKTLIMIETARYNNKSIVFQPTTPYYSIYYMPEIEISKSKIKIKPRNVIETSINSFPTRRHN